MNQKSGTTKDAADKPVKNIRRKTRRPHSPEEKSRIALAGLRGEESVEGSGCRSDPGEPPAFNDRILAIGKVRIDIATNLFRHRAVGIEKVETFPVRASDNDNDARIVAGWWFGSNVWNPRLRAAMILSGSAVHLKGLASVWLCSSMKRLMAVCRSKTDRKTPCLRRRGAGQSRATRDARRGS